MLFSQRNKITFIVLILCLPLLSALAAEEGKPTQQPPPQPLNSDVNPITKAAVDAGVLSCAGRINQVMNFLAAGSQNVGAFVYVPSTEPDRKLISISLEIQNANTPVAYASTCFAPNQANGCGAMYETVVYWDMKCDDVAAKNFAGMKRAGMMGKKTIILDGGPELRVFLMPAGKGCISIKKEVLR